MLIYVALITAMMCSINALWYDDSFTFTTATEAHVNGEEIATEAHVNSEENAIVTITDDTLKSINYADDLYSVMSMLGLEIPSEEEPFIHVLEDLEDDGASVFKNFKNTYKYISNPEQATCNPEIRAVELELTPEMGLRHYPTWVRVNRCGGCCPNKDIFACQPVAWNNVIVKVLELNSKYSVQNKHVHSRTRGQSVKYDAKTINVTVEEHTSCACLCILKEIDCNLDIHDYVENGCSCTCKNKNDEVNCNEKKKSHFWDPKTCQCLCRNKIGCSSWLEFNHETCACDLETDYGISWTDGDDWFLRRNAYPPHGLPGF